MTNEMESSEIGKMLVGKKVAVRANVAGVHSGTLVAINKTTALLQNSYRWWRIYTRDTTGSISDVCANGLKPDGDHHIGARLDFTLIENPQGLEVDVIGDEQHKTIEDWSAGIRPAKR